MGVDRSSTRSSVVSDSAPLKLQKVTAWCSEADAALAASLDDDRDEIARDVNAGTLELWRIEEGALWLVTRSDPVSRELIICCAQGRGLVRAGEVFYRIAQANGLRWVRFFSARKGMQRLLDRWNFELLGSVYRCEVASVGQQ